MARLVPKKWFDESYAGLFPLQRQMNRLFDDFFGGNPAAKKEHQWLPSMDVAETENDVIVHAEIPGIDPKELDITLNGDLLTLKGEKKEEKKKEDKEKGYYHVERRYGTFERTVTLPVGVDAGKIKAEAANGVLTVTLPKKEEEKVKSVKVEVK